MASKSLRIELPTREAVLLERIQREKERELSISKVSQKDAVCIAIRELANLMSIVVTDDELSGITIP